MRKFRSAAAYRNGGRPDISLSLSCPSYRQVSSADSSLGLCPSLPRPPEQGVRQGRLHVAQRSGWDRAPPGRRWRRCRHKGEARATRCTQSPSRMLTMMVVVAGMVAMAMTAAAMTMMMMLMMTGTVTVMTKVMMMVTVTVTVMTKVMKMMMMVVVVVVVVVAMTPTTMMFLLWKSFRRIPRHLCGGVDCRGFRCCLITTAAA